MNYKLLLIVLGILFVTDINAQSCTTLGQTPSTAFPVCGTKVFTQTNVPTCSTNSIFVPGCSGSGSANYANKNPYFYKFTCYTGGTLGFLITPSNLDDDYDWQLFDISGRNPNDIFTDNTLAISGNWSGNSSLESARGFTGQTGTKSSATDVFVCASNPPELGGNPPFSDAPTFSKMPTLIVGHTYLLMVSHFTDSQSGYTLEFNGGTASITDPLIPSLKTFSIKCDHASAVVTLGKNIRCNSIAADGSDFVLSPAIANVTKVEGYGCANGFDSDSLLVTFSQTLPPGNYNLVAQKGTDNNSLADYCDNEIPYGQQLSFTIKVLEPTHIDSLSPVSCAPDKLTLVFKKNIQCASIAPDGSDFFVTGPYPVNVIAASGNCNADGTTSTITISLSQPVSTNGTFTIKLKNGLDGNPIIDECGVPTPIGEGQSFTVKDTVNADFTYSILSECKKDHISFMHDGAHNVNSWLWTFDNTATTDEQNPERDYFTPGTKTVKLIVSNGFCSDTSSQSFTLAQKPLADFSWPEIICPEDTAVFIDKSLSVNSWNWDFGNGITSTLQNPPAQYYPKTTSEKVYTIRLIVSDGNCFDTTYHDLTVVKSCYIDVPTAFTPNGDGLNDYLYPLNAYKADNLEFKVFNRYGQKVFETTNWLIKWDGAINGTPQPTGTYAWYLKYKNRDTGKEFLLKGTTVLIR
ncbi:MAG: gliding motility-associated C-terminal domain-containing protein [Sphingobacteriales bacterium]|nr:gliding motility-associated C-terminal domain-containing protein [Sphingobacteriales bacterium]